MKVEKAKLSADENRSRIDHQRQVTRVFNNATMNIFRGTFTETLSICRVEPYYQNM